MSDMPEVSLPTACLGWFALSLYLSLYFGLWGYLVMQFANPWKTPKNQNTNKPKSSKKQLGSNIEKKIRDKLTQQKPKRSNRKSSLRTSLRILRFAFIHAGLWVGLEWLRGIGFLAFGWNGLGVAFHDTPVLAQSAEWVGATGLSFTPMLIASIITQTVKRLLEEAREGRFSAHWEIGIGVGLITLQFYFGLDRLHHFTTAETQPLEIMVVQNNEKQRLSWDEQYKEHIYLELLRSTKKGFERIEDLNLTRMQDAGEDSPFSLFAPELVLWPESSMGEPLFSYPGEPGKRIATRNQILLQQELTELPPFTLLSGLNEIEIEENGSISQDSKVFNSLAIFPPESRNYPENPDPHILSYQKKHLVPFGETIPFKDSWVGELYDSLTGSETGQNFTAGTLKNPLPYQSKEGPISLIPTICFEDTVAHIPRRFARQEPQLIVNITNDGWFGESAASMQHAANAKFRAIELRRPMVRAANTGLSCVYNMAGNTQDIHTGEPRQITDKEGTPFIRDQLLATAHLPKQPTMTLYALAGDWFCFLVSAFALILIVINKLKPHTPRSIF